MEWMVELIVKELRGIRRELRGIREGMAEGWRSEKERRGEEEEERQDDKRTEEEKKSGGKDDQAESEKRGNERKEKDEEEAAVKEEGMWTEEEESVEEERNGRSEEENRSVEEGGKRETKKEERGVGKKNGKEEEEVMEEKREKLGRRLLEERAEEERRKREKRKRERVRKEKEEEQERRVKRKRNVIEEERREKRQAVEGEKVCGREVGREEFGGGNGYGERLKEERKEEGYGEEEEGRKTEKGNVSAGTVQGQQLVPRERQIIWQGFVEWIEKAKNPTDAQKQRRPFSCQVSANAEDGDPKLKADTWPPKLIMQLVPKILLGSIGGSYLKNSKSVVFHPTPCEALESLTKMMTAGFAGCVHFTSAASSPACEIKVLILLYTIDKKTYLGFIPNDQTAFVDRLRKVIQQQKTSQATMRQGQANPGPGNTIPAPMPTTGTQGGILMSQTNTMAMGGGQITQNVVSTNAPPQTLTSTNGPQAQMNMQNSGISGPQANAGTGGMIGQQRPQFDDIEMARHQNLLKIQHLRQTLEAAQQQEAQYKSQLEVNIQQNLEVAQQQEMQYKQQLEAQQAQRGLNPALVNQQVASQRLMRPVSTNNLGLRHLLQQPQPQYNVRQVFGVQQQMVGPRGQIATRPMAPGNAQNQQFDDVPNYDFLG